MFDDGLIYRKYRVVNWDPKGQTVISDDEIVYEEREAVLYTFKYWKDFPISISTTRLILLETIKCETLEYNSSKTNPD